ncbi:MAG: anhydro-N-acetylmuramic acid kinase, partial [Candidatus Eremiobacteraeota bacterium]|nr:anhydro-N-acetylmuramic acid kinase [Candidatus Eremiobacteraeota bacterium]
MRALGLMSGTSLDGVDAALVDVRPTASGYAVGLIAATTVPFDDDLRSRLTAALPPHAASAAATAKLHADLGVAFAAAAQHVARPGDVDFVASHGLTLYHDGEHAITLQIGRPYEVRDALAATVVWDFRSADCAQGGQGAPLVPYVDTLLFASPAEDRVAVNVGGICNVTILPRAGDVVGFDTGPGVMLLDALVRERTGEPFDREGRYSSAGTADEALLERLLDDPYFKEEPPKSTGRERFGAHLLEVHRAAFERLTLEDACATLLAFTVKPLAGAIRAHAPAVSRVIVSGGGVHNSGILTLLRRLLPHP